MARWVTGGARLPRPRAARTGVAAGLLASLLLHGATAAGAAKARPVGELYHVRDTDMTVRHPGEDVQVYPQYAGTVTGVDLLTYLIYGHDVADGTAVAEVALVDVYGRESVRTLRAGIDTAETSYPRPEFRAAIRHSLPVDRIVRPRPTHAFSSSGDELLTFRTEIELDEPIVISRIRVRYLQPRGQLVIGDIFLRDF